jgi:hypothetical protein
MNNFYITNIEKETKGIEWSEEEYFTGFTIISFTLKSDLLPKGELMGILRIEQDIDSFGHAEYIVRAFITQNGFSI